jgi:Holliday junction resolvase RusA-like endonuclease
MIMKGRTGKQWIHHYYSKQQQRRNKITEKLLAKYQPLKPLTAALAVRIDVYCKVPKSYSKKKRAACLARQILPTKTPDLDNIRKGLYDQMQRVGYFKDDKQICEEHGFKVFSKRPRIVIEVWEVGDALQ